MHGMYQMMSQIYSQDAGLSSVDDFFKILFEKHEIDRKMVSSIHFSFFQ